MKNISILAAFAVFAVGAMINGVTASAAEPGATVEPITASFVMPAR